MFKGKNIDLLYRIISLLTYIVVIMLIDNIYVLIMLSLLIFINYKIKDKLMMIMLLILVCIAFLIGYNFNNLLLFKLIVVGSYIYYFFDEFKFIKKKYVIIKDRFGKGENIDSKEEIDYLRFNNKSKKINNNNLDGTLYVTFHLFFLFISILIGSWLKGI